MKYNPDRKFEMSKESLADDEFANMIKVIDEMNEDQLKWLVLGMFGVVNQVSAVLSRVVPANEEVLYSVKAVIRLIYLDQSVLIMDEIVEKSYAESRPRVNAKNN